MAIIDATKKHGLYHLGSEDATTCHIIVIKNPNNGKTALAHLDDVRNEALDKVIKQLEAENEAIIHIFGGYEDEKGTSEELSVNLLKYLIRSPFW